MLLEQTMVNIRDWMNTNRLKTNDSKTEFINFGSRQQLAKLNISHLDMNNIQVDSSGCIKYLGVVLHANLNLKRHIIQKCKVASFNLCRYGIRSIRKYLTQEACLSSWARS